MNFVRYLANKIVAFFKGFEIFTTYSLLFLEQTANRIFFYKSQTILFGVISQVLFGTFAKIHLKKNNYYS
jgi:hypothetical protein